MKVNPLGSLSPDAAGPGSIGAIIVIFGAAVRPDGTPSQTLLHRVASAALLGQRLEAPLFIPTGGKGRHGPPEAVVMARLLEDAGYPAAMILREETGTDTLSSVRAVAGLIGRMAPGPVFACTSAYHMPRCLALLRLAGIRAKACPPPQVLASARWWMRWYWRLREVPALPYDALILLWLRLSQRL